MAGMALHQVCDLQCRVSQAPYRDFIYEDDVCTFKSMRANLRVDDCRSTSLSKWHRLLQMNIYSSSSHFVRAFMQICDNVILVLGLLHRDGIVTCAHMCGL